MINMIRKFDVIIEKDSDSGYFIAEVPALSGCYSQGETMADVLANVKEAIELHLETLRDLNHHDDLVFVEIKKVEVNA